MQGLYRETETGVPMRLALSDGGLQMDGRIPLVPLSQSDFRVGSSDQRFVFESVGRKRPRIQVRSGEYEDGTYEPVDELKPSEEELRAYEGEYHSNDAETTLEAVLEDGALVVRRRPDRSFVLSPVYRDAFDAARLGFIRFRRDSDGKVVELRLRLPRVPTTCGSREWGRLLGAHSSRKTSWRGAREGLDLLPFTTSNA